MPSERFTVSNYPSGLWRGEWPTRESFADDGTDAHGNTVADYLDDDGDESDWFIRWPDGRIERMSYAGESNGFVDGK